LKITSKHTGDTKEAEHILKEENIGRLGTFGGEYPYVVPLCYVFEQGNIYFHSGPGGLKMDSIRNNNRVCFQVDQVSGIRVSEDPCKYNINYKSVVAFGQAEELTGFEEKKRILYLLSNSFAKDKQTGSIKPPNIEQVTVVKISIESMTVKINLEN